LSKSEKLQWVAQTFSPDASGFVRDFEEHLHVNPKIQELYDEFSENTLTNFYMPYGVIPNVKINDEIYCVPMVIEESSVVAAAAKSAKFWLSRGGFRTEVVSMIKVGQVHFLWEGNPKDLLPKFDSLKARLIEETNDITSNMRKRGGGILDIEWVDMTHIEANYYQLKATFDTCDSMGANFINSCLESFARTLQNWLGEHTNFTEEAQRTTVVMSILSNYTPECRVRAEVTCPIEDLGEVEKGISAELFAFKFKQAVAIARNDPHRATTHNKGVFNGIDAVILATGNDFRAVEACGHTYAARDGQYRSLTHCTTDNGIFRFWIDVPMAVGTVGGLTNLHPLVKRSLELLDNPNAERLMEITAVIGLAQNFGAVKSLVTTGIQKGHMKMHLLNILRTFEASESETDAAVEHFKDNVVSVSAVRDLITTLRK
ncbi:MAG: hydroxymethylglutaryl-CoA reductase, partial [Bacteroidota bacterium]